MIKDLYIDFILEKLGSDNISSFILSLADKLIAQNYNVRLTILYKSNIDNIKLPGNLNITYLDIANKPDFYGSLLAKIKAYFILSTHLAKAKARYVFTYGTNLSFLVQFIRISLLIPFKSLGINNLYPDNINKRSSKFQRKYYNLCYKHLFNNLDHIISQSENTKNDLSNLYNIEKDKITNIAPPANEELFIKRKASKKPKKLLFIAKLENNNNPLILPLILEQLDDANTTLTILGNGPLKSDIKNKIVELGLEERVDFIDSTDNYKDIIHKSDILLIPYYLSRIEPYILDAIAAGVIVIALKSKYITDIITDSVNGYIITNLDIDEFTNKTNKAIKSELEYKRMYNFAEQFHPKILKDEYIQVIKRKLL